MIVTIVMIVTIHTFHSGESFDESADYITIHGTLEFKHGETSKDLTVEINPKFKGNKLLLDAEAHTSRYRCLVSYVNIALQMPDSH